MRTVCFQRLSKALFIRSLRSNRYFYFFRAWTVRRVCVTWKHLDQRKHYELRTCALLVPNVSLALV